MQITRDHVRHVAQLCRLELSEAELDTFTRQLDLILGYVAQLEQLDTDAVEGTAHVVDLTCPWREDQEIPSLERDQILGQAPARAREHFEVPRVIE